MRGQRADRLVGESAPASKNSATVWSRALATLPSAVRPMEEMPRSTWDRKPIDRPERAARPRSVSPRSLRYWRMRAPTRPAWVASAARSPGRGRSRTGLLSMDRTGTSCRVPAGEPATLVRCYRNFGAPAMPRTRPGG